MVFKTLPNINWEEIRVIFSLLPLIMITNKELIKRLNRLILKIDKTILKAEKLLSVAPPSKKIKNTKYIKTKYIKIGFLCNKVRAID